MEQHTTLYTTAREAIDREVIEPIEASGAAGAAEFDIQAIADEMIEYHAVPYYADRPDGPLNANLSGFRVAERFQDYGGADQFWELVEQHTYRLFDAEFSEGEPYNLDPADGGVIDYIDYTETTDYQDISILVPEDEDLTHINGKTLSTRVPTPVSEEWEPEVYDAALRAAGWIRVGEFNGPQGTFKVRATTERDD